MELTAVLAATALFGAFRDAVVGATASAGMMLPNQNCTAIRMRRLLQRLWYPVGMARSHAVAPLPDWLALSAQSLQHTLLHCHTVMLHGYRLAMGCARKEHTTLKRSREDVARATGVLQGQ